MKFLSSFAMDVGSYFFVSNKKLLPAGLLPVKREESTETFKRIDFFLIAVDTVVGKHHGKKSQKWRDYK